MRFVGSRMRRPASALAALATLFLATCDLDKITKPTDASGGGVSVNFTITGGSAVTLGATLPLSVSSSADLASTVKLWSSANPGVASVDSETGIVTGVTVGTTTITARLLGLELGAGVEQSHQVTVGYKGIRIAPVDSIEGLGLTKAISARGLNASDAQVGSALPGVTWLSRDPTVFVVGGLAGQTVQAKKAGQARLVGTFNGLSDSVMIRVRPVAKRLVFPDTHFVADAVNANRTIVVRVDDMADSVIVAPNVTWTVADTNVATIGATTGVLRFKVKGTTSVTARADTATRSLPVRVVQVPATLTKTSGDAQTDTVLHAVTNPVTVTVLDVGGTPVVGETVTFRIVSGAGAVITDSVKVTGAQGRATLGSWKLGTVAGPQSITATAGAASATFTATALPASPSKLVFAVHPFSAGVGAAIAPAIKVEVRDSLDNPVTSATGNVTLSFGTKPDPAAVLGGTLTVAPVAGVATFNNITVSTSGAGFTLLANATGLAGAVSNSFDVFGVATKLGFVQQPVGSSAGGIMQEVRVAVQDAQGATVTSATDNVTITLGNPGTATLNGTVTVAAINGIAHFDDLSVSVAGAGYTLIAAAPSRTGATSTAFTVSTVGTPSTLAFSVQPANAVAGQAITPAVKVRILDQFGAQVTTSSQQITLALESGGSLSGTFAVNASSGEATFDNVIVNAAGTGYKLVATAPGSSLGSVTSTSFAVSAAAASRLGFLQHPTHTVSGQTMSPAVTVAVQDANGNTVASHPATGVTLALSGSGCTPTALSGGGSVNTVNGVATFTNIAISAQMTACFLVASATGLNSGSSLNFASVGPNGAVKLGFTTEPAATSTAGSAMTAGTVNIKDASGNNVTTSTSVQITISVLSGPGPIFSGSTNLSTTSSATFTNIQFRKAGTYRLLATAIGFDPDTSAQFSIVPGPANRLGFLVQPHQITAGVPFSNTLQVAVQDQYENTITGATNVIRMYANMQETPFSQLRFNNGLFEASATAVNGVATFPGLSVRGASSPARLHLNSADTFFGNSITFNVLPAPLSALGFKAQPSNFVNAGANIGTIEVQGQDSVGNIISSFANAVTLTLTGGNPAAVLNGTKTVAPATGVSSFGDLTINQSGSSYQLSASASGVTTATSSTFTINPGSAVKLGWTRQPQNTFVNAPFNPSGDLPQVAVQDQFGNTVSWGTTIRIQIVTPPVGMKLRDRQFNADGNDVDQKDIGSCDETQCGVLTVPSTLSINQAGSGIRLLASAPFQTSPTFATATSDAFNIAAFDTKTKVAFVQQPTNSSYGVDFNPTVKLAIQDQYGNTVTTATENITLNLSINPGAATLSTTSQAPVQGAATISPLTLDKAADGYVITASATGLTSAVSNAFNVATPGLVAEHQSVCDMTRSGNIIYWVNCNGSTSTLKSVSVFGGPIADLVIGIPFPGRIRADGTNVYWIEQGNTNGQGAVKKRNIATGLETTMASGLFDTKGEHNTFELDDTHVYFAARDQAGTTNAVRRVAKNVNGPVTPTDIFVPVSTCTGCTPYFTVGGGFVFAFDYQDGRIRRTPVAGGAAVPISTSGQGSTLKLVLSNSTLIYTQGSNLKTLVNATTASGEATPEEPIPSGAVFHSFLMDGGFLYANNNGILRRYSITDFAVSTTFGLSNASTYATFFADGTNLYVYNQPSTGHHIVKVPK